MAQFTVSIRNSTFLSVRVRLSQPQAPGEVPAAGGWTEPQAGGLHTCAVTGHGALMAALPGAVPLSLEFVKGTLGPGRGPRSEQPSPGEELQSCSVSWRSLGAVLAEVPGERPPGPGPGSRRQAHYSSASAREPGLNAHNQVSLTGALLRRGSPQCPASPGCGQTSLLPLAASLRLSFLVTVWLGPKPTPRAGTVFKHLPVETIQCSHRILSDYSLKTCLLLRKLGHT